MDKILLIKDNKFDAEFVSMILSQDAGFEGEIVWLNDGGKFLDYIEQKNHDNVLFALLDLKMPRISGIEVKEVLYRKNFDNFPVIVYSASKQREDIMTCIRLRANAFIEKTVDFDNFKEALVQTYNFWGKFNLLRKRIFISKKR